MLDFIRLQIKFLPENSIIEPNTIAFGSESVPTVLFSNPPIADQNVNQLIEGLNMGYTLSPESNTKHELVIKESGLPAV